MRKLFSKEVVDKIEGKINKNGVDRINIKELIVYISAFFNDRWGVLEEGMKDLKDALDKFFEEGK